MAVLHQGVHEVHEEHIIHQEHCDLPQTDRKFRVAGGRAVGSAFVLTHSRVGIVPTAPISVNTVDAQMIAIVRPVVKP